MPKKKDGRGKALKSRSPSQLAAREKRRPSMVTRLWLDPQTQEDLNEYAAHLCSENRSEALRNILREFFRMKRYPGVQQVLEEELIYNGDFMVFLRDAVSQFMENREKDTTDEFSLH